MSRLFISLCYLIAAWQYRIAYKMARASGSPYWRGQRDLANAEREEFAKQMARMSINFI